MQLVSIGVTIIGIAVTLWGILIGFPAYKKRVARKIGPISIGIVQKGNKVLLVKRVRAVGPLVWGFPTGTIKVDEDEPPEERVVKETLKETGIRCRVVNKIGERVHPDTGRYCYYFHCLYLHGRARSTDGTENSEAEWIAASRVPEYITSDIYDEVHRLLDRIAQERPAKGK